MSSPPPKPTAESEEQLLDTALSQYLKYYCSRSEPQFAVLVTGHWGTGKTYQVTKILPRDKAYYVSLFGLSSSADVIGAVYAAMFPKSALVKKIADGIGEITAEFDGLGALAVNGVTSGLAGAVLRDKVSNELPIIFDDLERCSLGMKEILGLVNRYVEHHKCRVIVIAHDTNIEGYFNEAKEKIFGQTIRIAPQYESAFQSFTKLLSTEDERKFVNNRKSEILSTFAESKAESLRILRHVIEDVARLFHCMSDQHRSHESAMADLVPLFVALDIEVRCNRLIAADLTKRSNSRTLYGIAAAAGREIGEPPNIVKSQKFYELVDLTSPMLQDHVLVHMFVDGRFDGEEIRASLNSSHYFIAEKSEPWKTVINFDKLDDGQVVDALDRMIVQFRNREISDIGEMLHIFSLLFLMTSREVLGGTIESALKDCKDYIIDMLRAGRLQPTRTTHSLRDEFDDSAHGIVFWVEESYRAQFLEVRRFLNECRYKALLDSLPSQGVELLEVVRKDGQKFFSLTTQTARNEHKYYQVPVLAEIPPAAFVTAWMQSPKENWYWISKALEERYRDLNHPKELESERPWIDEVVKLLKDEAERLAGIARFRIERRIPQIPKASPKEGAT